MILNQYGKTIELEKSSRISARVEHSKLIRPVKIKAKYDSAQTDRNNANHWANTDALSPDASNSPGVRKKIRERARYEYQNNCYCKGMIMSVANHIVGKVPTLQLRTGESALDTKIERDFAKWAKEIRLGRKLRSMVKDKFVDGETIGTIINNPKLKNVTLDLKPVKCDRLTDNYFNSSLNPRSVDGIVFDDYDNPVEYHIMDNHPGSGKFTSSPTKTSKYSADYVVHWFLENEAEQHRGISEISPALPLFAYLRRYTLAVVSAAESLANLAYVIQADAPAGTDPDDVDAMDTVELERNVATTLPFGWKLAQAKAEQPTGNYKDFKHEIINEIARCILEPYNIAAGNSAGYNYASGRLDHQDFYKAVEVIRSDLIDSILDKLAQAWLREYFILNGIKVESYITTFFFDGLPHVDPVKEAKSQDTHLRNNTTTLADEYAKQGQDWESKIDQRILEKKKLLELAKIENEIGKLKQDTSNE